MSVRIATKAAQTVLKAGNPGLVVDGDWGPKTENSYTQSPSGVQQLVEKAVSDNGYSLAEVRRRLAKPMKGGSPEIRALVAKLADENGVPVATAMKIAYLESRFNPNAKSPTGATGVFQMTGIAIRDVNEKFGTTFTKSDMLDPEKGIKAGLLYIKLAAQYMSVSPSDIVPTYMAFNIGAGSAKKVLMGRPGDAAAMISHQAYGRPEVYAVNLKTALEKAPSA